MAALRPAGPRDSLRGKAYHVIFEHDAGWARRFDAVLIVLILASVGAVMLDSVAGLRARFGPELLAIEWFFTVVFTLEYVVRVWCVRPATGYMFSFFGLTDLLSVLPTYLSMVLPGGQYLAVIRVLRVVRVFRIFKLVRFVSEATVLTTALRNARYKIAVFITTVMCIVVVVGSVMYVVEGPAGGFTSIPRGVYWAIVTLTTVGYGDIAPHTPIGQTLASFVMLLGYAIIAVPTGIVTAEIALLPDMRGQGILPCPACERVELDPDARYCRFCGTGLKRIPPAA
jgi:voltage-gated potassium channel